MTSILDITYSLSNFGLRVTHEWNGRTLGVFGPSGSGKTTLLEILVGLRSADGSATLGDHRLFDASAGNFPSIETREVGWVPQDASLFPHMTCEQNIRYGHVVKDSLDFSPDSLIETFELGSVRNNYPRQLSGGERIRTALARAVARNPKVLLLDEPLASLDVPLRHRIFPFFVRLKEQFQFPIVYVSHQVDEIWTLTDEVVVLERGEMVAKGPTIPTLQTSTSATLEEALNLLNRFDVEIVSGERLIRLVLPSGRELLAPRALGSRTGRTSIRVSPDEILLSLNKLEGISARNQIHGTLQNLRTVRGARLVEIDAGELWTVRVTADAEAELHLRPKQNVTLLFKASAIRAV